MVIPTNPQSHSIIPDPILAFPAELKACRVWCLWRYEERNGEHAKVPYQVSRVHARSNDPSTWATFGDACSAISGQAEFSLGIFADGAHTFIDLDKCIDPHGTIEPWAQDVLFRAGSYAELSPSGSGLHIFLAGSVVKASKINGCEIYSAARFFTVTGKHVSNTPSTVNALSAEQLEELRDDIAQNQLRPHDCKKREPHVSPTSLVATKPLSNSERETKLERALSGDVSEYRGDRSAAVHGALQFLARKHQGDREAMEGEFCASQLCSDWGSKWDRLCETELNKAIERWRENGEPAWNDAVTTIDSNNWRGLFHTREETEKAPPITFAIEGFLQETGITMLGGLPGHGKTLVALAMVRALLEGSPLFGYFKVPRPAERIVYMIPESGLTPFASRLKTFQLVDHVGGKLFYRTFSAKDGEDLLITDPRIRKACEGADVFLDTAVRFMDGDENAVAEQKIFARNLFALLRAGARTVTGLHHAPKSFEKDNYMSLENILRGSGDIGAMLTSCWGLRQIDKTANRLFIENAKARDFLPSDSFIIEGRPHLDATGYFKMTASPGVAGTLNQNKPRKCGVRASGRPEHPEKAMKMEVILKQREEGKSLREIGAAVGLDHKTVGNWLAECDATESPPF